MTSGFAGIPLEFLDLSEHSELVSQSPLVISASPHKVILNLFHHPHLRINNLIIPSFSLTVPFCIRIVQ